MDGRAGGGKPDLSLPRARARRRHVQIGLPSGQDVCRAMQIEPMSPDEIATGPDGDIAREHGLHEATPLWY